MRRNSFEKVFVIDTNIILNDAQSLITLSDDGDNLIVLPETVIDEVDTKKTIPGELGYQARSFSRLMTEFLVSGKKTIGSDKNTTIVEVFRDNVYIHIISMKNYKLNDVDRAVLNDRKILKVAKFAESYYKNPENTVVMSEDANCRIRAISFGMRASAFGANIDTSDFKFIKELHMEAEQFNMLDNKPITGFDPDYVPKNYGYKFYDPNKGHACYGIIKNGMIKIIDPDEMKSGKHPVKPLNEGQQFALAGLLEDYNVNIIEAKAGSGKNVLAVYAGMRLIDLGKYDKIVYIRNSVESVDKQAEVGFLPGLEDKFKIYNYPLYDTVDFIASLYLKKKPKDPSNEQLESKADELINKYQIQTMWVGELRGRTIKDAYIIIDEASNCSTATMNTILTRVDKSSKVVVIGSNTQIDHAYLTKKNNGLTKLLDLATKEYDDIELFATNLDKAYRGPIVEWCESYLQ